MSRFESVSIYWIWVHTTFTMDLKKRWATIDFLYTHEESERTRKTGDVIM